MKQPMYSQALWPIVAYSGPEWPTTTRGQTVSRLDNYSKVTAFHNGRNVSTVH